MRERGGGGGRGNGVGMRSRYNHGENYFQAPGRIISTPLRRLGGGG